MYTQLITFILSLCVVTTVWAQKNQLNLFIWSEYIDPQIIADFEKEYDCKVTIDLYEDNEAMLAKLQGGGVALYDICVPSDYIIPALLKLQLLAPLRHENIPNLKHLEGQFTSPPFDPGNKYTVAYQWGTSGIYLRKKPDEAIEETWGLIFDAKKQPGAFLLIDDMRAMIGAALIYKGYSVNSTDPQHLKEARHFCEMPSAARRALPVGWKAKTACSARVYIWPWHTTVMLYAACVQTPTRTTSSPRRAVGSG